MVVPAMAEQETRQLLASLPQTADRCQARPHQIPHRLMGGIGNPHRRQLARAMQLRQVDRVSTVEMTLNLRLGFTLRCSIR